MEHFKNVTSSTNKFSDCFFKNEPFSQQVKKWSKLLNGAIRKCFEKLRVRKKQPKICKTFKRRKNAIQSNDIKEKQKCENEFSREQAEINFRKIKSNMSNLTLSNNKQTSLWKIKNKFFPKVQPTVPVARRNISSQLISNSQELKLLYLDQFTFRMRSRPIMSYLEKYKL